MATAGIPQVRSDYAEGEGADGFHNEFRCQLTWITDYNRVPMPVAGEDGQDAPPEVCDLAAPTTRLVAKWTLEKVGGPPALPHVHTGYPDATLLRTTITGDVPPTINDETVWRLSGEYVYALGTPVRPGDELPLGKHPVYSRDQDKNKIMKKQWQPMIGKGIKVPAKPFANNISGSNKKSENE